MMETETEAPLNKKDITEEITGRVNFDELEDETLGDPVTGGSGGDGPTEETLNPLIGIMDQMIVTSPRMLEKRGYPSPNLEIWDDWAKPNLSKAFNAYVPEGLTSKLESPLACLFIGAGALILVFLPVILHFMDKKQEKEKEKLTEPSPEPKPEKTYRGGYEDTYEEPVGVSREPTKSTAAISEGPHKAAWDRIHEVIASQS
jgi:hypothetical protein